MSADKCCTCCGITKAAESFSFQNRSKGILKQHCKECSARQWAEYSAAHKDRLLERDRKRHRDNHDGELARMRAYSEKHKERRKETNRAYREANKECLLEGARLYYSKNREHINAKCAEWRKRNPKKAVEYVNVRRARIRGASGRITPEDIAFILKAQQWKCAMPWCRADISSKYEIDHIVPISAGGANNKENAQGLCPTCNRSKHARDPISFMQSKGFLL